MRSVRRDGAALAQNIKLLAQDSKPGTCCLLNLVCRLQSAGVRLRDLRRGISQFHDGWAVAAGAAPKASFDTATFRDSTMCIKSSRTSGRLRTTQAFIALSSISEGDFAPKTISIARIGIYEIRMFSGQPRWPSDVPLVWIELFDHDAGMSVDSCGCHEIDDALAGFDALVAEAENPDLGLGPEEDDAQA